VTLDSAATIHDVPLNFNGNHYLLNPPKSNEFCAMTGRLSPIQFQGTDSSVSGGQKRGGGVVGHPSGRQLQFGGTPSNWRTTRHRASTSTSPFPSPFQFQFHFHFRHNNNQKCSLNPPKPKCPNQTKTTSECGS